MRYCQEKLQKDILHTVECIENKYVLYFLKDNIHIWMPIPMPMPMPMPKFPNGYYFKKEIDF